MAKVTVGTTPVQLPVDVGETPAIQNLGPGVVYLDTRSNVATGTGLQIPVNTTYEWPKDITKAVYAVADTANTDVRVLVVG